MRRPRGPNGGNMLSAKPRQFARNTVTAGRTRRLALAGETVTPGRMWHLVLAAAGAACVLLASTGSQAAPAEPPEHRATEHSATAHPATAHPATAHPATAHPATAQAEKTHAASAHPWGAEVDLVQPFIPTVHIIKPKVTRTVWGGLGSAHGDVVAVVYVRPHIPHDVVETIDEYMLGVGYRQYLWGGLHLEALVEGGVAWGRNKVDGRDYTTPTLFGEVNVGYRLGFSEPGGFGFEGHESLGFFVAPQLGTLFSLGVADIGPRDGKPDWFLQGNLLVGTSF
ncbi:MAG: hypothetical protein R3B13_27730 [Polyangiaceae bacterium]